MKKEKFKPLAKTVQELFSKRGRWIKDDDATNSEGHTVAPRSKQATKFCLMGGIEHVYNTKERTKITNKLAKVLDVRGKDKGYEYEIACWNDNNYRTFKEVKELVKKAGI
jgi:hypothetical protein